MEAEPHGDEEQRINSNDSNTSHSDDIDNGGGGTWGTWEELLLASAVKRHGFGDWESVASEVQARTTSLPPSATTAALCRRKYTDLHRRFAVKPCLDKDEGETGDVGASANGGDDIGGRGADGVPWLEELRSLRVAELKREVQQSDVSILSLQLKVKRLEEERERSARGGNEVVGEEDDNNKKKLLELSDLETRSENDKEERENDGKPSGSHRDKEDEEVERSVNESNSTGSKKELTEPAVKAEEGEEDVGVGTGEERKEEGASELGGDNSVSQVSSEAQSSASLGRKRRRKERSRRAGDGIERRGEDRVGPGGGGGVGKSEPLVCGLLDMVRAHKHGSIFECRIQSQETDAYKNLVRQHLDLDTIESRLEQGSYASYLSFCRDLLLLFNNAIVFFPRSSIESVTARELRSLVSTEMKNEAQKSDSTLAPSNVSVEPKSELQKSDSLLNKHKASAPLVLCRKRSSISGKPSSSALGQKIEQQRQQKSNDSKPITDLKAPVEQSLLKLKSEDKPVTGTRSSRRTNKAIVKGSGSPTKKQTSPASKSGSGDKSEGSKADKKKSEASAMDKKRSAADFLKRIKTNSPGDAAKKNTRGGNSNGDRKKDNSVEVAKGKEKTLRKSSDRRLAKEESSPSKRPPKKAAEARTTSASGKRGREDGRKEVPKRPQKRSRR